MINLPEINPTGPIAKSLIHEGLTYTLHNIDELHKVDLIGMTEGTTYIPLKYVPEHGSTAIIVKLSLKDGVLTQTNVSHVDINRIVEDTTVGLDTNVTLMGINNNQPIKAKIDTGADLCSLHATDIKSNNQQVTFTFAERTYTTKLHKMITIARAGDEQQRPTIRLTAIINDTKYDNVEINLSDRSGLDTPFLLGKNLIEIADIKIDPNITETILFNMDEYYDFVSKGGADE